MKKKKYEKPSVEVVVLKQQGILCGSVTATMDGLFTEETLAPEFTMEDDFIFQEESFNFQGE